MLAVDPFAPEHILLGSGGGALFVSNDGGRHWQRLANLGAELMIKCIVFDPLQRGRLYAAGWNLHGVGGGLFFSTDGGQNWSEIAALHGQSVQALAVAQPAMLVAGTLDGLYRSLDRGASWQRITPAQHPALKNFESLAIDPQDARILYAGTWHLPWKTVDGGQSWTPLYQGMLDDSDIFSLVIDQQNASTLYVSACSGIYQTNDGGQHFRRLLGLPHSATRAHFTRQAPRQPRTLFVGTTGGLWKSMDGGQHYRRITPPNFILNDLVFDPRDAQRLLIATERGGVYASDDGGQSWHAANEGFSQRQITALLAADGTLWAGVINDKEFGGVFRLDGKLWQQRSEGLEGNDVLDLIARPGGGLLAATPHGIYALLPATTRWQHTRLRPTDAATPAANAPRLARSRATSHSVRNFDLPVNALASNGPLVLASAAGALLASDDQGASWRRLPIDEHAEFVSVAASKTRLAAATGSTVWQSVDDGHSWHRLPLPDGSGPIHAVNLSTQGELWAASDRGVLHWLASATTPATEGDGRWQYATGLPARAALALRQQGRSMLATVADTATLYESRDGGQSWHPQTDIGWQLSSGLWLGERLYLVSRQHGILQAEESDTDTPKQAAGVRRIRNGRRQTDDKTALASKKGVARTRRLGEHGHVAGFTPRSPWGAPL